MVENRIIIIGAGGHGRVVADCLSLMNPSSDIVFLDDQFPEKKTSGSWEIIGKIDDLAGLKKNCQGVVVGICLLYTSPSPRDLSTSRMPSSA